MAAQAAYQMLCGDFDQLTGPNGPGSPPAASNNKTPSIAC